MSKLIFRHTQCDPLCQVTVCAALRQCLRCVLVICLGFCAALAVTLSLPAAADETRFTLVATGPRQLNLVLSLDPVACLHRKLAPSLTQQAFLAKYAFLPIEKFESQLPDVFATIEKEILLSGPDEINLQIKIVTTPTPAQWQGRLRDHLRRLLANSQFVGHAESVELRAQAVSNQVLNRVQLSLPAYLFPILVVRPDIEQFHLNEMVPIAIVDF